MAKLYQPEGVDDNLRRVQQAHPQREGTKLVFCGLQDVVRNEDVEGLCHTAIEMYANELGGDCEDANFYRSCTANVSSPWQIRARSHEYAYRINGGPR
jgi:hypothetical protein